MITLIYNIFYFLMFFILFIAGKELKNNGGKIFSWPGILAISAYTLNEGLRFGRGINYSDYWQLYDEVSRGIEQDRDVCFVFLVKIMSSVGVPYQGLVILESFMFILGTLFLLRNFRELLPIALPLFTFYSYLAMENMIRWYLGFSFILFGLSYLLNNHVIKYFVVSMIGGLFHFGLLPLPFLFYLFYRFKKPFLHPLISIPLYLVIGYFFQTDMMLEFTDLFNLMTSISERTEAYQKNMEIWLTGGYGGIYKSAFPPKREMLFLFLIVWCGHRLLRESNHKYVYVYNLFLFGFLVQPIANQIELSNRYHTAFFFFRALVLTMIIYDFVGKRVLNQIMTKIIILLLTWNIYSVVILSFKNPQLFMYVWDRKKENWDTVKQRHLDAQQKEADMLEKHNKE